MIFVVRTPKQELLPPNNYKFTEYDFIASTNLLSLHPQTHIRCIVQHIPHTQEKY